MNDPLPPWHIGLSNLYTFREPEEAPLYFRAVEAGQAGTLIIWDEQEL